MLTDIQSTLIYLVFADDIDLGGVLDSIHKELDGGLERKLPLDVITAERAGPLTAAACRELEGCFINLTQWSANQYDSVARLAIEQLISALRTEMPFLVSEITWSLLEEKINARL